MKSRKPRQEHSPRWWPAVAIIAIDVILLLWVWFIQDSMQQMKVVSTLASQAVAVILLLIWLLFFSRLNWKPRLMLSGGFVVLVLLFATFFRFKEFSGDIVPTFEWRWKPAESAPVASSGARSVPVVTSAEIEGVHFDYPQFLGPERHLTIQGLPLAQNWEANPPQKLWRQPIGEGWSAFSVVGRFAVTQEQAGAKELVSCYDMLSGKLLWKHEDRARFDTVLGGIGPRATPTVIDQRVFALGATGILNCLELETGKQIWSKNILTENEATMTQWGLSCSPLVIDSLVVVTTGAPGRSLAAYHHETGELQWAQGSDPLAYSSPVVTTLAGVRQIVIFNRRHVVGHQPQTGEILWRFPWPESISEVVAQPLPIGANRLLLSTSYGGGSKAIELQVNGGELKPRLLWESNRLKAKFTNLVYHGGYVYGLDDGILTCIDADDGKRKWKRGRYGHGQLILVDSLLLVLSESGEVILVEATPHELGELSRFTAIEGKTWNNPALAGQYLLVRNSQEAACYRLPLAEPQRTAAGM